MYTDDNDNVVYQDEHKYNIRHINTWCDDDYNTIVRKKCGCIYCKDVISTLSEAGWVEYTHITDHIYYFLCQSCWIASIDRICHVIDNNKSYLSRIINIPPKNNVCDIEVAFSDICGIDIIVGENDTLLHTNKYRFYIDIDTWGNYISKFEYT